MKNWLHHVVLWTFGIFLTDELRRPQPTVGSTTRKKIVLSYRRRQTEQAMGSKSVQNTPPCNLLQSKPPGFCLGLNDRL